MGNIYELKYGDYLELAGDLWIFNQRFNGLFCINKSEGKIKHIFMDTNSSIKGKYLYSGITYWNNRIILIPMTCSKVALFDVDNNEFQYIDLDRNKFMDGGIRSLGYYKKNEYLYMFPANMTALVKINLNNMQLQYVDIGIEIQTNRNMEPIFRNQFEVVDNNLYMPFVSYGGIAVYDLETDTFDVKLQEQIKNCSTISYKNGKYYIGSWKKKKIYLWNGKDNDIDEISIDVVTNADRIFNASWIQRNKLVLFPYHSSELIVYDIECFQYLSHNIEVDMENNITSLGINKKNYTAHFSGTSEIKVVECVDDSLKIASLFKMDENYNNHIIAEYLNKNGYIYGKEKEGSLNEMLDILKLL